MQNNAVPPQGGLTTDGQKVDPVSGNEVPLGSNAQEVRDDLPAQLSEGEYVVPSDIVRYYGVKFFEDLRDKGKGGLNDMAANGRIGGQPMPQGGPQANDITPEEVKQMQRMLGRVSQQFDRTEGYSIGGFGTRESITTPSRYTGAFSWETPDPEETGGGEDEGTQVTLYCPDGSINVLQLPADQDRYDELTQQGCGVDTAIAQPKENDDPGVKDMPKADPTGWMKDYGYVKWEDRNNPENGGKTESWDDIWQASMDALEEKDQNLIERLLSGGVFGKIQQATVASEVAGNWAVLNANAQTQEEKDKVAQLKAEWDKYTKEKGLDLLPDEIINGDQRAKQVNSTQVDWALGMNDVDIYGKPLFDSEEEFIKQMEETASDKDKGITATYIKPGATYTDSITGEQKTNTGEGFLQMNYDDKKSGYLSTMKPKPRPTDIKPIDGNQDDDDDEGPEVTLLPDNYTDPVLTESQLYPASSPILETLESSGNVGIDSSGNIVDLDTGTTINTQEFLDNVDLTDDDMGLPSEPVDFSQFETETASAPMTMAEQYASYGQGKAGEVDDGSYQVATSDPTAAFDKFIEDTSQPLEITTYTGQPQKDDDDPNTIFKPVKDTGGYDEAPVTYTPPPDDDDDDPTPAFTYTAPASDPYAEPGRPTSSKKDDDPNSIFNKPTTTTTSSAPSYTKPAKDPYAEDRGGRSSSSSSSSASSSKGGGCVIATHAVASGSFQWSDKENAMEWCKKALHDKWWGETMRRGYRYLGRKHIANGTAETIYKEFKECIEWANGKRPFETKIAARYYYRAIQTFFVGLFVK